MRCRPKPPRSTRDGYGILLKVPSGAICTLSLAFNKQDDGLSPVHLRNGTIRRYDYLGTQGKIPSKLRRWTYQWMA